jgi:hypothetical protein
MGARVGWFIAAALAAVSVAYGEYSMQQDLGCVTDTECAQHCPPPADDPDCDGGPQ